MHEAARVETGQGATDVFEHVRQVSEFHFRMGDVPLEQLEDEQSFFFLLESLDQPGQMHLLRFPEEAVELVVDFELVLDGLESWGYSPTINPTLRAEVIKGLQSVFGLGLLVFDEEHVRAVSLGEFVNDTIFFIEILAKGEDFGVGVGFLRLEFFH